MKEGIATITGRIAPTEPALHAGHYTKLYRRERSDSPEMSRVSLIRRMRPTVTDLAGGDFVLNVGSGPQILERQFINTWGKPAANLVTLDVAAIDYKRLLARNKGVDHVRGSGSDLPFGDDSFAVVVSNMALDFIPNRAIGEIFRVLTPGGKAFVNLHHPDLIPKDIDERLSERRLPKRVVYEFWQSLRDEKTLFTNEDEIRDAFGASGLTLTRVAENHDSVDKWWEVDLIKQMNPIVEALGVVQKTWRALEAEQKIRQNWVDIMNA